VAQNGLQLSQAVADHGDEPQEGDAGKGHQVQSAKEGLRMVDDLRSRSQRIGGLEFLISRWLVMNSREKRMPAMAAARGVLRLLASMRALGSLLPPGRIIA
jgi:hypothetical protein